MDREKILDKAKLNLMVPPSNRNSGSPIFYSSILISLRKLWSTKTKTAAVDGKNLYICETFFCGITPPQRVGLLAHEILHIAHRHIDYFHVYNFKVFEEEIEHKLYNKAGDYVINLELREAGYELPPNVLIDYRFRGMSTLEVYRILHDEYKKDPSTLDDYDGDTILIHEPKTAEEKRSLNKLRKDITAILVSAKLSSEISGESIGSIPGDILRLLDKEVNPKLPFEVILANYMSSYAHEDYSFTRPNRRYLPDLYMPSLYSEALEDIVCAFDLSGSVSDTVASSFRNATRIIKEQLRPKKMTLIAWDTDIRNVELITDGTNIEKLNFTGGGGTNVQPVIDWIRENKPPVTLIFTDGDFYRPDFTGVTGDIIWLIEGDPSWVAPYGKVFHYTIEEDRNG